MKIPDFSIPTAECFLTVDKHGTKLKVGDILATNLNSFRGSNKEKKCYNPVTEYEGKLVVIIKPSHMLNYFAKSHCEIKKDS